MKPTIALIGPPAGGKSTLISPYQAHAVQLGEYTKTLPQDSPLLARCHEHWKAGTKFSTELVTDLLASYPIPSVDWLLLDGTPRSVEQIPIIERMFDMQGYVRIVIDENIWEERALRAARERGDRYDSTMDKLRIRRAEYERDWKELASAVSWYEIDNSGDVAVAQQQLDQIVEDILKR